MAGHAGVTAERPHLRAGAQRGAKLFRATDAREQRIAGLKTIASGTGERARFTRHHAPLGIVVVDTGLQTLDLRHWQGHAITTCQQRGAKGGQHTKRVVHQPVVVERKARLGQGETAKGRCGVCPRCAGQWRQRAELADIACRHGEIQCTVRFGVAAIAVFNALLADIAAPGRAAVVDTIGD